jgi:type I restriction enzyme M protein
MITITNLKEVLNHLGFKKDKDLYIKKFKDIDAILKVDFKNKKLIYPTNKGFTISGDFTTSFTQKENFVVFECVHRLFEKGYKPNHIELEPKWTVGHGASGGRADIMVKDNSGKSLLIIECKTAGKEFEDEWKKTLINGGQIFSYAKQAGSTKFVALYASDFIDDKVVPNYYLVTLKDNEKLLEELADKEPLSYEKAKLLDKEDIYKAWKETYAQDYATKGLFENDIPAYDIGKTKYSLKDLDKINSNDIQGKYHQFATIMRQHNVSGRENAFDKLVNLFLCKIVDETNNPDELKFYWKGIAYDSFFELQDRLQKLYQEGMKRFLGEDVTYIDNEAIDQAFRFFKNDPDATKETIKKYFRELKFFTNNDFAFIDVHNEKLFYQNATVLLKIVQMLQDIRLKTEEENQFLGDMFEGFLDQGVRQSEGQFFTPMPIVKFILKSLPLEEIIDQSEEIPKVIDYACGAGHFLNEYAKQITPIVKEKKEIEIEKYYDETVGIEKEYRLSKVAKVSAFMYGQDDVKIIYGDALTELQKINDNEYSVLVANPPYSVKGFLETLSENERKRFELTNTVSKNSYANNNSIETYFIERAKQLLKPGGVAAIIVPASILTKGKAKSTSSTTNIYVATREILLKYFDIISIAEFGKGTFGKTGTNTVTLFIRRKQKDPDSSEHYKNRIIDWFEGSKDKNGVFEDEHFLKKYCEYLEIDFKDYESLLIGNPTKKLLETEFFDQYKKEFDKWTEIKNRKKLKTFKALTKKKQEVELHKRLTSYLIENEKDRLYYFILASINPQNVVIVKSPSKTTEMKEFLGYEWSSAKGNEGIKYLGETNIDNILEGQENADYNIDLEEDDKRVLSNIYNLNNIKTPLYDPEDSIESEKVNQLIESNFENQNFQIPESLKQYVSSSSLVEMINFNKIDFNKSISLTPRTTYHFETKWEKEKLGVLADVNPSKTELKDVKNKTIVSFVEMSSVNDNGFISNVEKRKYLDVKSGGFTYFKKDDIIIAKITPCMENGKCAIAKNLPTDIGFGSSEFHVIRNKKGILNGYIFALLNDSRVRAVAEQNMTGSSGHRRVPEDFYKNLKIPFPDISIQKKIIKDFNKIESDQLKSIEIINVENKKLDELYTNAFSQATKTFKLSDDKYFKVSIGKRVLKRELNREHNGIPVFSANVFVPFGHIEKKLIEEFIVPSVTWGIDGDWMVNSIEANKPFYPTDHCGVLRVIKGDIHHKYLAWILKKEGDRVRFSRTNRASMDSIKTLNIKVPSKTVQDALIVEVEKSEIKIRAAETVLENIESKKHNILIKHL